MVRVALITVAITMNDNYFNSRNMFISLSILFIHLIKIRYNHRYAVHKAKYQTLLRRFEAVLRTHKSSHHAIMRRILLSLREDELVEDCVCIPRAVKYDN